VSAKVAGVVDNKLYDLTYKKVLVVQPDFGSVMTAAEYAAFDL
jgi:hypothetical protein